MHTNKHKCVRAQRGLVRVTVAPADKSATHVIITVEDTGIGIAKHKIPSIWGAFEQVSRPVARSGARLWCAFAKHEVPYIRGGV